MWQTTELLAFSLWLLLTSSTENIFLRRLPHQQTPQGIVYEANDLACESPIAASAGLRGACRE